MYEDRVLQKNNYIGLENKYLISVIVKYFDSYPKCPTLTKIKVSSSTLG